MSDPRLDEEGRCKRTELLPEECACAAHQGGEDEEELAAQPNYLEYLISRFRLAQYDGRCKLVYAHKIQAGQEIGLAVREENINDEVGWVCAQCTNSIAYPNT